MEPNGKRREKVLLISAAGVGDWFIALPLQRILAENTDFTLLCMDNVYPFAKVQKWLPQIWEYKISEMQGYSLFTRIINFIFILGKIYFKGIDTIILPVSVGGSIGIRSLLRFSFSVKKKIGFDYPGLSGLLTDVIPLDGAKKDSELNSEILKLTGHKGKSGGASFRIPEELLDEARVYSDKTFGGNKFIVLHPYANLTKGKRERWLKDDAYKKLLGEFILDNPGTGIFLVGSHAYGEKLKSLAETDPENIKVVPFDKGLLFVAGLIHFSSLVLCVDGGIMHISASMGKKIVSIWGPTPLRRTYESEIWKLIRHPMPCHPCWDNEMLHKCGHLDCLHKINPDEIVKAVNELLNIE